VEVPHAEGEQKWASFQGIHQQLDTYEIEGRIHRTFGQGKLVVADQVDISVNQELLMFQQVPTAGNRVSIKRDESFPEYSLALHDWEPGVMMGFPETVADVPCSESLIKIPHLWD